MQISPISFCSNFKTNAKKIQQLEQKHARIQYGTEGCNGSLSAKDEYELQLRRELQKLQDEQTAVQYAAEGCNGSLPQYKLARMDEIKDTLKSLSEDDDCDCQICENIRRTYEMPKASIYDGVPASTFYGDWAN